jgi:uncharacterized membrane protein
MLRRVPSAASVSSEATVMPWRLQSEPNIKENIIAGVSYLTGGIAGLIYTLLTGQGKQSRVFRFNFIQSILLSIIATLFSAAGRPLVTLIAGGLSLISPAAGAVTGSAMLMVFGAVSNIFLLLLLYGAFFAFQGKFAEVPFISKVVRQNMGV